MIYETQRLNEIEGDYRKIVAKLNTRINERLKAGEPVEAVLSLVETRNTLLEFFTMSHQAIQELVKVIEDNGRYKPRAADLALKVKALESYLRANYLNPERAYSEQAGRMEARKLANERRFY